MMKALLARFRPAEPRLRAAVSADAGQCAALHAEGFARGWDAPEFERLLAEKTVAAHVACDGPRPKLIGFVLSHVVAPESEVLSITVAPDRRGRGIARQLLGHHLARLAAAGVTTSFLEVEAENASALRLYSRLGYVEAGRRKGYYPAGGDKAAVDALMLRRDL